MATVESNKLDRLREIVRGYGSALVAFSGGADSALVLKVAADELGARARALLAHEDHPEAVLRALGTLRGLGHRFVEVAESNTRVSCDVEVSW